jgi:hypothetical protein
VRSALSLRAHEFPLQYSLREAQVSQSEIHVLGDFWQLQVSPDWHCGTVQLHIVA